MKRHEPSAVDRSPGNALAIDLGKVAQMAQGPVGDDWRANDGEGSRSEFSRRVSGAKDSGGQEPFHEPESRLLGNLDVDRVAPIALMRESVYPESRLGTPADLPAAVDQRADEEFA